MSERYGERCQRCGDVDQDRRTLWMACFYAMEELAAVPFKQQRVDNHTFYTLRVCKECRGEWMKAIQAWFLSEPSANTETGTGVFIRDHGATREATNAEVAMMIAARMHGA